MMATSHQRTPTKNASAPNQKKAMPKLVVTVLDPSRLKPPALQRPQPSRMETAEMAMSLTGACQRVFFLGSSLFGSSIDMRPHGTLALISSLRPFDDGRNHQPNDPHDK